MNSVHVAILREVKPGQEQAFESAICQFIKESRSFDGVLGAHLLKPAPSSNSREYGILRSFSNEDARKAFYASDAFHAWEEKVAPLVTGKVKIRDIHGLEAFFRDDLPGHPPRWKMAVLTWFGVFPCVQFWSGILPAYLNILHPLAVAAVVTAVVVVTLAWVVMPLLTKLFAPWLHTKR